MTAIPRSEHPRPDFERDNWMCLNGEWDFSLDEKKFDRTIIVPFAFETELSGIGDKEFHIACDMSDGYVFHFLPACKRWKTLVL